MRPGWAIGFTDKTGTPNPRGKQFADPGGYGIIEFSNGTRFFVDTSEDTGVQYSFQIVGAYGRIIIDELNDVWEIRARNDETRQPALTRYGSDMPRVPFRSNGSFDIIDLTSRGLAELVSGKPLVCTASDGKKSLEMVVAFHVSDDAGNVKITVPPFRKGSGYRDKNRIIRSVRYKVCNSTSKEQNEMMGYHDCSVTNRP